MDWRRDDAGQWVTQTEGGGYVIRGGPGAWWFERVNMRGVTLAVGRTWGSPAEAKAEAEDRERV